ncbi:MAG: tetratricopeptide repeat protein [Acidobacteria bacterium]|nr:tetratricopeptide repeat protein [Acidobacteriota bacterium]MCI0718089.1 tetratricopeptide repeat protein [Acidobacteriota bacterium]
MRWILFSLFTLPLVAEPVTFNKHIAPLVFQYCSPCHRRGEAAPFPLLTYEDVRKHASQIVAVTERRYMPPWSPEPGYGDFVGERRLTAHQLRLIAEWVKEGALEGKPGDLPPEPQFTEGWQIGPPDLVVQMPKPYRLEASGSDVFRNFVIPVDIRDVKYVRAIELRPGNKRVVHHANIWIDRRQSLRRHDGKDGQPGFPGMDVSTEARSDFFEPDSHFLFWKPGTALEPEPEDISWRLDPGTDLILNLHLKPSGKEETLQPLIGFYFTSEPPRRHPMLLQLEHDGALDIAPGSLDYAVEDHVKLPVDVDVLAIYPHAHYLGKKVEAWATLPDGTRRWLIRIADWDINWQAVYTYRYPVWLPKGSTVKMRISYDNSASNPRNPNHPPKRVRTGPRSEDEMGHVWLQVLPKKESAEDPRLVLQEVLMQRRLEKYPGDFVAHCNLGALRATRGEYRAAISNFQQALQMQPSSATARNGLGASLLGEGRVDEAMRELRKTLDIDPTHLNARLNLSRALARKEDWTAAAVELNTVLKQKPDNADAQVGLGTVYSMQGRFDEALPYFQRGAQLKPADADIRTQLGAVLANRGDLSGAITAFQEALRLNPNDEVARAYLEKARAELASKR